MLVMPHLFSISTSEASTTEKLAEKRDKEFIIALPEVEPNHKLQKTTLERRTLVMHRKPTPLPLSFDGEDHVALAAGDLDELHDALGGDNLYGDGSAADANASYVSVATHTTAYVARHAARVRGALGAVLRPTSLANLIKDRGFNEPSFTTASTR